VAQLATLFCNTTATTLLVTVLGKQIFDLTGSELALGFLGLAEFAPSALLVFVTGTAADRFDRRRLTSIALVLEAAAVVALAWYTGTGPTSTLPIFALVAAFGTARAFGMPPQRALPADIVEPTRLPWLAVRQSATWQVGAIVGPVLGGFLYVTAPWVPFVAAAGLLAVGAVLVRLVRPRPRPGPAVARPTMRDALEGLRFLRGDPVLLGAISLDLFAVLFGGAVALLPAIADQRLHVGAVGLGWLRASVGIGAAAVTLVLAVRPVTRRVGRTLLVAVALFGAGTIVLGVTRSFAIAFVSLALLSGADAVSVFVRSTLVPLVTPHDKRGRVLAVEAVFVGASNELGAFESGVAGQVLGVAPAVVLGGVATLGIAAVWSSVFPALRDVDRFPDAEAEVAAPVAAAAATEPMDDHGTG